MRRAGLEAWFRRARRPAACAALIFLGVLAWRVTWRERARERGDTRFYRLGARLFWEGENLYIADVARPPGAYLPGTGYTYLPPFAAASLWMLPVPYPLVRGLWLVLMAACAVGAARLAWRLVCARGPPAHPHLVAALGGVLVLRFVANDLAHGQVNLLVTVLLMAALLRAQEERPGSAGLFLGLALVIKPTAWPLLPWFLLGRPRPRLVGVALGTAALLVALCGLRYGLDAPALLGDWLARMRDFADEAGGNPLNASLSSALLRLASGVADRTHQVTPFLFELDPSRARPWARVLSLGVAGAVFAFLAVRRREDPAAPAALLVLAALLSPVTWKAHLVVLLLPALFVARELVDGAGGGLRWALYLGVLVLFFAPSRAFLDLGRLEAWGGTSAGLLVLLGLVLSRLPGAPPATPAATSGSPPAPPR